MSRKRRDPEAILAKLWSLEDQLVASGFPAMPRWWRRVITRFYCSGKRRMVIRKGRRVYASTCVAPRLAVAEALFGGHEHLPGTPPLVYAFLSVHRGEAANRLRGIREILDAIGVEYRERGETIELMDRPAIFAVKTVSERTTVGDDVAFAWCDEVSRWRDDDSGSNPAEAVIGGFAPSQATLPDATMWLVSSPRGRDDYHARQFDLGETEAQCVAFGATWEINEALTEEETRRLEPDDRVWSREYAAQPQAAVLAALDPDAITRAQRDQPAGLVCAPPVVCVDMSDGRGDATAWAAARWAWTKGEPEFLSRRACLSARLRDGRGNLIEWDEPLLDADGERVPNPGYSGPPAPILIVGPIRSIVGRFWQSIRSADLVARIAADARAWGARFVIGDQRSDYALEPLFAAHGLRFVSVVWSNPSKVQAVTRLRSWLRDGSIILPQPGEGDAAARLSSELAAYQERLSPSGSVVYGGRSGVHDDHVATLLTAAMADARALLPASPTAPRVVRDFTNLPPA